MPEYDRNLECVSHAGRHRCNGTCRTQHSVYVGTLVTTKELDFRGLDYIALNDRQIELIMESEEA